MEDQIPTPEPQENTSCVSGLFQIFVSPTKLFSSLTEKKAWLLPLIVVGILALVLGQFTRPIITRDMVPTMKANFEKYKSQVSSEQYAEMMKGVERMELEAKENKFHWYYIPIAFGFLLVIYFIIGGIGWISGNFLYGGKANFWLLVNVVAFATLIGFGGDLVRGIMMIMKDSSAVYTGLGMLKPIDDGSFTYYLFRQIDAFSIWRIAATSIGFAAIYKMKTIKFAMILFIAWGIFIALVAGANIFAGGTIIY